MAAQRPEISLRVLKNISRVSAPFELLYDELKVTKCCTKTFCLCWVLRACAQPRRRSVRSIASCRVWNVGRPLSLPPPSLSPPPPPHGLGGGYRRHFRISFYQIFLNGTGLEMCFAILSVIVQPPARAGQLSLCPVTALEVFSKVYSFEFPSREHIIIASCRQQ